MAHIGESSFDSFQSSLSCYLNVVVIRRFFQIQLVVCVTRKFSRSVVKFPKVQFDSLSFYGSFYYKSQRQHNRLTKMLKIWSIIEEGIPPSTSSFGEGLMIEHPFTPYHAFNSSPPRRFTRLLFFHIFQCDDSRRNRSSRRYGFLLIMQFWLVFFKFANKIEYIA